MRYVEGEEGLCPLCECHVAGVGWYWCDDCAQKLKYNGEDEVLFPLVNERNALRRRVRELEKKLADTELH